MNVQRAAADLLRARLQPHRWDEVRAALSPPNEVALSRLAFEAKVGARQAGSEPLRVAGGKGSPAALIAIGLVSAGLLVGGALALGGGLLLIPAAIPAVTVIAVLGSRWAAARRGRRAERALSTEATIGRSGPPPDVREVLERLAGFAR